MLDNVELLFKANSIPSKAHFDIRAGSIFFPFQKPELNFFGLQEILRYFAYVRKRFGRAKIRLVIDLGTVRAADKLTITLLECIVYGLVCIYHYPVKIIFNIKHTIFTECIRESPLKLGDFETQQNIEMFKKKFERDFSMNHFRKIVPADAPFCDDLSQLTGDIKHFLSHLDITQQYADALSSVAAELVGNANEHNQASCLLDLDVSLNEYSSIRNPDVTCHGVNLSIVCFSDIEFGFQLKEKLLSEKSEDDRFKTLYDAYREHSHFFDRKKYTQDDFFRIAAFQDRISSRGDNHSGGTGLTMLLKSVEDMSEGDHCYLMTSQRALYFIRQLLNFDDAGWIGFNTQQDFAHFPPESGIIQRSPLIMPGTAYNLNFACNVGGKS